MCLQSVPVFATLATFPFSYMPKLFPSDEDPMRRRALLSILPLSVFAALPAGAKEKTVDLSGHFAGFDGTFVLYDLGKKSRLVHNAPRSEKRFSPCSTFKIPNSLIGLETGVIADENFVIPWDGVKSSFESWNRDHTLSSAIRDSVVWYYQELARRVGETRMREWLDRIEYGNRDISGGIDRFWLGNTLAISAREQVDFLRGLQADDLPFSKRSMEIVRRIMIQEETFWNAPGETTAGGSAKSDGKGRTVLRGKTGSHMTDGKWTLGWFVGWVERDGNSVFFAANISATDGASGRKAREIALGILKEMGYR